MGKTKKPKKVRAKQLDRLKELDGKYCEFNLKLDIVPSTKYAERRMLIQEQIQIHEQSKELYFARDGYKCYWDRIGELYSRLLSLLVVQSQNYSEALDVCQQMLQFSPKVKLY
ncbi:predicted protein [Chaetoceros tenuissimus]|uniref:Uncharacterized protein n=1 Tax=Chaetoceros tenuissimus TaxID=426638 RepID=A0AAD3DFB3_9STRA|nr:predicted protein [Chaetoceros tenuissimus]